MSDSSHHHQENQAVYTRVALVILAVLAAIVVIGLFG